jgi:hypothetical protein
MIRRAITATIVTEQRSRNSEHDHPGTMNGFAAVS